MTEKPIKPSQFAKLVFSKKLVTKDIEQLIENRKSDIEDRKFDERIRKQLFTEKYTRIGIQLVVFGTLTFIALAIVCLN